MFVCWFHSWICNAKIFKRDLFSTIFLFYSLFSPPPFSSSSSFFFVKKIQFSILFIKWWRNIKADDKWLSNQFFLTRIIGAQKNIFFLWEWLVLAILNTFKNSLKQTKTEFIFSFSFKKIQLKILVAYIQLQKWISYREKNWYTIFSFNLFCFFGGTWMPTHTKNNKWFHSRKKKKQISFDIIASIQTK